MSSTPKIIRYANIQDEETGEAFEVLKFRTVRGGVGTLTVPRAELMDPVKLLAKLIDLNADVEFSDRKSPDLLSAIEAQPRYFDHYAAQTGWHSSRRAFVAATGTIARDKMPGKLFPPQARAGSNIAMRSKEGNLQGWKTEVACRCLRSSVGTLVLSAAFAAPLLRLLGMSSFGLNLCGPSKTGKSAMLLAAASVSGASNEFDLANWDATDAAIGELCRLFNDDLLPLNEVGLMSGTHAQKFERIRKMIFQIGEGRERQRYSASPFATKSSRATYTTLWVSSAEHAFAEYARAAGIDRDGGELARCADIYVVRDGQETIFRVYPPNLPIERRKAWARQQLRLLRRGCADHHGVAQEAFIRFLLDDLDACVVRIESLCERFLASVAGLGLDDVYEHRARNFAVIFAAGVLAIEAGILDFDEDRLLQCIRWHLVASIRHETGATSRPSIEASLNRLRELRIASAAARSAMISKANYDGFRNKEGNLVIHAARLREIYRDHPGAHREVLSWLDQRAAIVKADGRMEGKQALDRTLKWPNGKMVRSIVIAPRLLREPEAWHTSLIA